MYRLLCHKEIGEYDKALELADYLETGRRKWINIFRSPAPLCLCWPMRFKSINMWKMRQKG